jgi:glycosyltransferase involved in cell wall biosynthesis
MKISIIIPIYNEAPNINLLADSILAAMNSLGHSYEVIFINDGSSDSTETVLSELTSTNKSIKSITFKKNFGQTAAMMAGIDHSTGEIIIPIDGDLQNDPRDIELLLNKLGEGYDVASGWRKNRKDSGWRNVPSRIANKLISWISGIHLHDYGCTLKAYRRDVIENVRLYGEMHRFIPIYSAWQGGRVAEVVVSHHPRIYGKSKYGMNRIVKVLLDLIVIKFLIDYSTKPIYVFGTFGFFNFFLSIGAGIFAFYLKIFKNESFISTPLPLFVALTFLTGILSILLGLVAEISMRTYHESQGKPVYIIRNKSNF